MSTVLIARFKNKKEAALATRLIKLHVKSPRLVVGNNLEDLWLGEMIDEGMKEKRNHSIKTFEKRLDKQIKTLSR